MQFTLLTTIALFAATALAQDSFAISQPTVDQCQPVSVSWQSTKGPYNVIVTGGASEEDVCKDPLQVVGDFTKTFVTFTPNSKVLAGEKIYISVLSSDDSEAWTRVITVGAGDSSCLPKAASAAPSTDSSKTTTDGTTDGTDGTTDGDDEEDDTTPDAIGAAAKNVGGSFLNGSPASARVGAPVMALSAFAALAVLAL